ncbi:MAG: CO dehydrogenase/CO-methylating acetyl-CoA synthase complex subunit beta [Candidatus Methanomethylicia archaeon]|nr:CO dehydrogenase/CO-methylating acetyl-CoA synthase complex subunit beta [Candidatus Methanomethylicia archaeon]MCX8168916.1 CO dehydrogenase/CO-methylating acetyl-CoA synthase complex subunit beta [Candidatus Methanomethylicia archaeon]
MFIDIPVDVGPQYEGQRIRREDMHVEFGGPKLKHKFEIARVKNLEEIDDGKIIVVGQDINELKEGGTHNLAIIVEVAGRNLTVDAEGVIERRIHEFCNYTQGFMHLNQRYDIWLRVGKKSFSKGLNSFKHIGTVLYRLFKSAFPIIEKFQVTFITEPQIVEKLFEQAIKVYNARDERTFGLKDEEVDVFYSCRLCQSFAPTHVCIITPERPSNCGAITWIDAMVAAKIDPKGPIAPVYKGKLTDPIKGEWSGVNENVRKLSGGAVQRITLYSAFENPHTSCGCFECVTFYVPEVDGLGIVQRGYAGVTPVGLKFGDIADSAGGGKQIAGFYGLGVLYMRTNKFLQADGGWNRIVWMSSELKQKILDAIPLDLREKIPTEKEVKTIEELKKFLVEKGHPSAKKIVEAPPTPIEKRVEEVVPAISTTPQAEAVVTLPELPLTMGGFSLILKNVKIKAEKLIIKRT